MSGIFEHDANEGDEAKSGQGFGATLVIFDGVERSVRLSMTTALG